MLHLIVVLSGCRSFLGPEESLLSSDAIIQLLEKLLKYLLEVLLLHDSPWTRAAPSYILFDKVATKLNTAQSDDAKKLCFELARSALKVVEVCMPIFGVLQLDPTGSQLLSTIFCLYWAFLTPSPRKVTGDDFEESEDERREEDTFPSTDSGEESSLLQEAISTHNDIEHIRYSFLTCLENLRRQNYRVSYQKLNTESRAHIRGILTEIVRSALVLEESSDTVIMATLCANWVCEIVEDFCVGDNEIQDTISCTLAPSLSWPVWVADTQCKDDSFPVVKFLQKPTSFKVSLTYRFLSGDNL